MINRGCHQSTFNIQTIEEQEWGTGPRVRNQHQPCRRETIGFAELHPRHMLFACNNDPVMYCGPGPPPRCTEVESEGFLGCGEIGDAHVYDVSLARKVPSELADPSGPNTEVTTDVYAACGNKVTRCTVVIFREYLGYHKAQVSDCRDVTTAQCPGNDGTIVGIARNPLRGWRQIWRYPVFLQMYFCPQG